MNKTLSISIETCNTTGIPLDCIFSMAALYFRKEITEFTFRDMCSKGLVVYDSIDMFNKPINLRLTEKGTEAIESVFLNSEYGDSTPNHRNRFDILADKLKELYPGGKKPGTAYMWRDSTSVISKKLKAFFKKYEDSYIAKTGESFSDEVIIEATQKYVNSFNEEYQYMQLLKYFINKRNPEGDDISQLLSYIENKDDIDVLNDDWRNSIR